MYSVVNLSLILRATLLTVCFVVASCGGGGGGSSSSNDSSNRDVVTWRDAGTFDNDVVVHLESSVRDQEEIYRIGIETGSFTKLTPDMAPGGKVARMGISPDGKKLAYVADQDRPNQYELYISNADGSQNVRVIEEEVGEIRSFSWSPNSQYLTYFWQSNPRILDLETMESFVEPVAISRQWSADSSKLARIIKNSDESYSIQIVNVDDGFSVTKEIELNGFVIAEPRGSTKTISWNGDLSQMLFHTPENFSTKVSDIYIIDMETSETSHVVSGERLSLPVWSPNGRDIAYWGENPATDIFELFIYNTASRDTRQITNSNLRSTSTVGVIFWENSGNDMYFMSDRPTNNLADLFVGNTAGDEILGLMENAGFENRVEYFRMAPDARYIVIRAASVEGSVRYPYFIYDGLSGNVSEISSFLGSSNLLRGMGWTPDAKHFIHRDSFDTYKMNANTLISEKITFPETTTKDAVCFVVAAENKNYCNTAFIY